MSHLRNALADYLTMRRALGYKMDKAERLLGQFVAFAEDRGETQVRTETALAWATLPAGADPIWTSRRLAEVRLFARHLRTLDGVSKVRERTPRGENRLAPDRIAGLKGMFSSARVSSMMVKASPSKISMVVMGMPPLRV